MTFQICNYWRVIRDGVGKIALGDFVIKKGDRILVCSLYNNK